MQHSLCASTECSASAAIPFQSLSLSFTQSLTRSVAQGRKESAQAQPTTTPTPTATPSKHYFCLLSLSLCLPLLLLLSSRSEEYQIQIPSKAKQSKTKQLMDALPLPLPVPDQPIKMDNQEDNHLQTHQLSQLPIITPQTKTAEQDHDQSNNIVPHSQQNLADAQQQEITTTSTDHEDNTGAQAAEDPLKEDTKETEISIALAATDQTPQTVPQAQEPIHQSDVASHSTNLVMGTDLSSVTPQPDEVVVKAIDQVKDRPTEAELPETSIAATSVPETFAEDRQVELAKEAIKELAELPDATPVVVSDVRPISGATEEIRDAEPTQEVEIENLESIQATPSTATEMVNESADLKLEIRLPEVQTEGLQLPDTSDAATGEVENKETEMVKEEIKEFEFPDSSLAVAPVVNAELIPGTRITEATEVSEMHIKKDEAPDKLAESMEAESEVSEALPEKKKKKKRALGDHLAEEKVNDSLKANKQASYEKPEIELSEEELIASASGPTESTQISTRDVNITADTKTVADEEKEENEKVVANATSGVTATEAAPEQEGEKVAEKESVAAGEAAKEEVASKPTSRSSNTILSKVKHQIVKVKKAIVKRSPSSKNMPVENKEDIKVK